MWLQWNISVLLSGCFHFGLHEGVISNMSTAGSLLQQLNLQSTQLIEFLIVEYDIVLRGLRVMELNTDLIEMSQDTCVCVCLHECSRV